MLPIHQHLATQLDGRLTLLRHCPKAILIHGADAGHSQQLLQTRYPQAHISEMDARANAVFAKRKNSFLNQLLGKNTHIIQQDWQHPLPEAQYDMLWSNLSLLHTPNLLGSLKNWAHALKTDGVLFFTHLGRDSLAEIRQLLQQHHIACTAPTLLDMHDLADMLQDSGFYDPVTDRAQLVLDYQNPSALLNDLADLNAWTILMPRDIQQAQHLIEKAAHSGSLNSITLEIVFGHGIKQAALADNEQVVQFYHR